MRDPIGLFDSGVGGLTVLREVRRLLPEWDALYVADSANCPYGARPPEEIRSLSEGITRYLLARGACCIVVACNTASAAALHYLRGRFPGVGLVGMVPAVKPAAALTRSGTIGVLATPATLAGQLMAEVVERHASGVRVLTQACPGLVQQVEAGDLEGPVTEALLRRYLEPLLEGKADVIVLGCTHYPFLIPAIRRLVGPDVPVLDPSEAVARQVRRVLEGLPATGSGRQAFASTGQPEALRAAVRHLLGVDAAVQALSWQEGRLL
ncbi:MAG: glutamate racemase [Anaerolineae bacterium]|nr:glutamate racemase [Anaerolineae bacterium]